MLHGREIKHILVSVSKLSENNHTVEFMNDKCIVKESNWAVSVGERSGGIYFVILQRVNDKALATSHFLGYVMTVWR